jgi:hypothetical protein
VIGISLKDRSAILPAGHMADGAFWFDTVAGSFAGSTYYFAELPGWVKEFNATRPADRYRGTRWLDHMMPDVPAKLYPALDASPYGNELVEALAERALAAERLGQRGHTDLLTVSFSANDYVGHRYGPDSPEVHDMCVQTDRLLARLFDAIDRQVGLADALVVFTADHGVAPVPEVNTARRMPGGRLLPDAVGKAVQAALTEKFGEGRWVESNQPYFVYLNRAYIAEKKLDLAAATEVAAAAVRAVPHVFRVYTASRLQDAGPDDDVGQRVRNGFFARRSPDLVVLLDPYWIPYATGASHASTFSYDSHVPVIFMGPGIRAGRYHRTIMVNDIAPTLATLLGVETPAGSVGRVLSEIIE